MEKLWETLLLLKVVKLVHEDSIWERVAANHGSTITSPFIPNSS